MPAVTNAQLIAGFYAAIFNRAPDPTGLAYWEDQFSGTSSTIYTLAAGFTAHPVFTTTYAAMANQLFVESIYQNILGAGGDAEGISYWTAKLDGGEGRSTLLADFVHDALTVDVSLFTNLTQTERDVAQARQDALTNKADVGLNFAASLGAAGNLDPSTDTTTQTGLESDTAYLASQAAIANVTSDPASVTTANAAIAAAILTDDPAQMLLNPPGPMFTVTLTDGVVSFANGTGDIVMTIVDGTATFVRDNVTATTTVDNVASTDQGFILADGQTLDMSAADAHLFFRDSFNGPGTLNVVGPVSILDVENLAIGWIHGTLNYTLTSGDVDLTTLYSNPLSVGALTAAKAFLQATIDHATNGASITLNVLAYTVEPDSTSLDDYNLAAAATGSDAHATIQYPADTSAILLNLTDYTANPGYIAALQAATHDITVEVDDTYVADSTVVNNGNVTLSLDNGVTSVDLSAATGTHGFTIDGHGDSAGITIVGSAHDDIITSGTGNDTLTGGGGSDTFNVTAPNINTFSILSERVNTITDLTAADTLNIEAGATATATGVLDFTGFHVNNEGTLNIDGTTGDDIIVGSTGSDVITSGGDGNDTLTGNGGGDQYIVNGGTSTLTDLQENDLLIVQNGATAITTLLDLSTVDVSNDGTLVINGTAASETIIGSSGHDVINGGAGNDIIKGSAGADSLTGGLGSDTFSFVNDDSNTYTFAALNAGSTIADGSTFTFNSGTDVITDFVAGVDLVSITGLSVMNASYVNGGSISSAVPNTGEAFLVHGAYSNNVFSASAGGPDTLAIYNDGLADSAYEAIVLTGASSLVLTLPPIQLPPIP
jgi:hypothetical protein